MDMLVNKSVKTRDIEKRIDYTDLVLFMYSRYELVEEVSVFTRNSNVVYVGSRYKGIEKDLKEYTNNYVWVCNVGSYDVDFTIRKNILECVYSKHNKQVKENIVEELENYPYDNFVQYCKEVWTVGKSKLEESHVTIWDLYKTFGKSRAEIFKVYVELKKTRKNSMIFSSILSFIEKSQDYKNLTNIGGAYYNMLKTFHSVYGNEIPHIIKKIYTMKCSTESDREYRTLYLLLLLGRGTIA